MSSFDSDNLADWLSWLETLHPKTIELGLDRLRRVAENLDLFSRVNIKQPTIIAIAGTNGKGTCVAALQAFLLTANKSVGAYTSPHLLRYNERVAINGQEIEDEELVTAFRQIEAARGDVSLSYFEYGTLATFLIFLKKGVDYWILEVGLGGRLDAVNLLDPDIAIVTSIDLDHQDWLGDTREQIALEKAGVYRANQPAICVDPDPPQSLIGYSNNLHANLFLAGQHVSWKVEDNRWHWSGKNSSGQEAQINGLPLTNLPIPSISAALQALSLLHVDLSDDHIRNSIANLNLPGRCQAVAVEGRQLLLDVAHNPAAAQYLARRLQADAAHYNKTRAVFAVMADKDIRAIVNAMAGAVQNWYSAQLPDIPRAASLQLLNGIFSDLSLSNQSYETVSDALSATLAESDAGDRIVIFGSFYTVAEGLQWLQRTPKSEACNG